MSTPDVVIVWGIRSIMSLVGILTIVTFYWYTERKWDEEGAAAYERAVENAPGGDYSMVEEDGSPKKKFVTNSDGSRDAISVATEDFKGDEIEVPKGELEKAHSKQYGMIVGFTIWAISFLFLPGSIQIYGGWNISFILFLPVIVFLITSPIRTATIGRDVDLKKKAVSTVLVLAIWLCVSGIVDSRTNAPWFFCFFGGASIPGGGERTSPMPLFFLHSPSFLLRSRGPVLVVPHYKAIPKNGNLMGNGGQARFTIVFSEPYCPDTHLWLLPHLGRNQCHGL